MRNSLIKFYHFLIHIYENKELIYTLILNDFKKQYLGSYFGLFWAFVQPLTYILVIWFVFTYGFRPIQQGDTPYFFWLITGMIPWFFLADSLTKGTNAIVSNAFLVKKVSFRVSILPLVQIGSAFLLHLVLLLFLIIMALLNDINPSIYWLQIPYYIFCATIFLLGITWLTSSLRVFIKDINSFINVVLQIGFWATPIFWNTTLLSQTHKWFYEYNPAYYIVQGYRDSFINHIWFWEHSFMSSYFLIVSFITFIIGALTFRALRPHFGDVL